MPKPSLHPPSARARTLENPSRGGKPRLWAAILFLAALAGVLWGSLTPSPPSVGMGGIDKVQHFGAYVLLAGLAFAALRGRSWPAVLGLVVLGVGVEVAQMMMALGRQGSWLDILANTGGALLVAAAWPPGSPGRRSPWLRLARQGRTG